MSEKQLNFNFEFKLIPETLESPFNQHFLGYVDEGLSKCEPGGAVMPTPYKKGAEKIYRFKPRKDDTWIVTFPKCGTTWTQEMVWMIVNNCDTEGAKKPLGQRSPFLEYTYMETERLKTPQSSITLEKVNQMPSPRVIKSHMPFYLLPPDLLDTCKTVYVARNPKDAMVSYYHHHKLIKFHDYKGNLEQFAQYFMDDKVLAAPFFDHILEAWAKRDHPNLLFIFYEDMKKNLRGEIEKVAKFLNKQLTDEQINLLREHLRFDNFQKNESVNNEAAKKVGEFHNDGRFIRNGKTGDWKNHFNPELNQRIDEWIAENLAGTDLKFITELDKQD